MLNEVNEDYMAGYRDGIISGNGYLHARLHQLRMVIEEMIDQTIKPEILDEIAEH